MDNIPNIRIISWSEAKKLGLKRYFPGKPCPYGHITEKWVASKLCLGCREANREKHKEDNRVYNTKRRKENPEYHNARAREYNRQARLKNPEKFLKISRDFALADPQRIRDYANKWRKNNPEKVRIMETNKKARRRNAEGKHTAQEIRSLYLKQHENCAICFISIKETYHVDHIIPIIKGGSNYIENIQLLCPPCNMRKGAKDPLDFARELGKLL